MNRKFSLLDPSLQKGNIGDDLIVGAIQKLLGINDVEMGIHISTKLTDRAIDIVNSTDGLIICGTNLYEKRFETGWGANIGLEEFSKIKVPIAIIGVGLSIWKESRRRFLGIVPVKPWNALDETGIALIKCLHKKSFIASVRDEFSFDTLINLGVDNVHLTGCPSLFMNEQFYNINRPAPDDYVCFSYKNMFHSSLSQQAQARFAEFVAEFHARFSCQTKVLICCHSNDDLNAVPNRIPTSDVVLFSPLSDRLNYQPLLNLYSHAKLVVGVRLHATIPSTSFNVPSITLVHDSRSESFCTMMGLPWVTIIDNDGYENETFELVSEFLSGDRELAIHSIVNKKKELYGAFDQYVLKPFNAMYS